MVIGGWTDLLPLLLLFISFTTSLLPPVFCSELSIPTSLYPYILCLNIDKDRMDGQDGTWLWWFLCCFCAAGILFMVNISMCLCETTA